MEHATQITLPRSYFQCPNSNSVNTNQHVFDNAKTKPYGAVAYLCNENQTSLVVSKSRVAPWTGNSTTVGIYGRINCSTVSKFCQASYGIKVFHFRNPYVVRQRNWLNSDKTLKQFFAHRAEEIEQLVPATHWNYCPTRSNHANLQKRQSRMDTLHVTLALLERGISWSFLSTVSIWITPHIFNYSAYIK